MLYDLNVPWSSTQNPQELQRTISFLSELGYDTIALNHHISCPVPFPVMNPIPGPASLKLPSRTTILRRCTVSVADPSIDSRFRALVVAYDIVAIRPLTEKAFLSACQSFTEPSIISLDLSRRHNYPFKQKPLMTAVNRGIMIEICYAQATIESSEARRNFISNTLDIIRATKGRGLIISSGAAGVLGVRGPADIVNLMAVWGLGRERGSEALGINPRGVVVNERLKRTSFRGVVDVIDGGERAIEKPMETKSKGPNVNGAGKRRIEENGSNEDGTPIISKRQKKRMKIEAKKAELEKSSPLKETPKDESKVLDEPDPNRTIKAKANG